MTRAEEERQRYQEQAVVFGELYSRVESLLEHFGRPDKLLALEPGDFTVHGDYSGYPQVVVFAENLRMLEPRIVSELQCLIKDYPGWQIEITVAVPGHDNDWPNMGLYIRPHEIVDALQRQYFPKDLQNIQYEGARRGTAYD
jgi:hypothetical protein